MSRFRAQSAVDRDLHAHLGRAAKEIRAALGVCIRAKRASKAPEKDLREQMARMARAERLLATIGHLEGHTPEQDLRQEARSLCAWLESRERAAGVYRPARRGQEYQDRLRAVLAFLEARVSPLEGGDPVREKNTPSTTKAAVDPNWVLMQRAHALAAAQGEADNDAYVMEIYRKLSGGVAD